MSIFTFGKHKGDDIEDVPSDYLQWFITKVDPPPVGNKDRAAFMDFVSEIEDELASRKKYGRQP